VATISSTPTSVSVTASTPATPGALFALLSDPRAHADIDGSGMVRGTSHTAPVAAVGEVFSIQMHQEPMGDYQVENHVVELVDARVIAWSPAGVGKDPIGHTWRWELSAKSDGTTTVVHSYDWSDVDDAWRDRISFPRVSGEQMAGSVDNLLRLAEG
jgi:hypothetical protein